MNSSQSIGLNATQSVGAMKMTSVIGDASMFITGKLTEMIDGDVHSETKMERNEISTDIQFSSNKSIKYWSRSSKNGLSLGKFVNINDEKYEADIIPVSSSSNAMNSLP
ncbi:hypothetical protein LUD75_18900 [Epilithonimonas sp. JDS]|uniref:hypothetical protein n=1 Tax=Epilithonimonas sp. JDS TaxID=2902797 RepID=UPI001E4BEED6|nr:hypothetical protein [Epilithonimonas sp. JDS]MCD9856800.1 hypothetical protein [Epilithonimonas sp. JDS]